jgi:hypothetical protein
MNPYAYMRYGAFLWAVAVLIYLSNYMKRANPQSINHVYVLNLPEKSCLTCEQLRRQAIPFKVWPGVRLSSWNDPVYTKLHQEGLLTMPNPDITTFGNGGVAAAHITLWQHLITVMSDDGEIALIMEDDEKMVDGFMEKIHSVFHAIPGRVHHINLNALRPTGDLIDPALQLYKVQKLSEIKNHHMPNVWASAYVVSKYGIKLLLNDFKFRKFDFSNPKFQVDYAVSHATMATRDMEAFVVGTNSLTYHTEKDSARQDTNGYRDV